MFKIFFKSTHKPLKILKVPRPGSWIYVVNPNKQDVKFLTKRLLIPLEFIRASLDAHERPRCEKEEGLIFVIVKVPMKTKDEIVTMPIGIVITKNHFVTISLKECEVINEFKENMIKNFFTTKRTRFLLQILARACRYFTRYLELIDRRIDKIESRLTHKMQPKDISEIFNMQKTLTYFNTAVVGNGNVIENILKGRIVRLYEEDKDILDDIAIENKQATEMVSIYSNILSNTLNTYTSLSSHMLNVVMKFLTSITVILSFPTIISSFYGMNVALPLQKNPYAFLSITLLTVLLCLVIAIIFIKKRWI